MKKIHLRIFIDCFYLFNYCFQNILSNRGESSDKEKEKKEKKEKDHKGDNTSDKEKKDKDDKDTPVINLLVIDSDAKNWYEVFKDVRCSNGAKIRVEKTRW